MKYNNIKIPTYIFGIAVIVVIIIFYVLPQGLIDRYSGLLLVLVTMFYAYFTYLLLITTKTNIPKPCIDAQFILKNKLEPEFIERYGPYLREDDRFKRVEKEAQESGFNKDLVFLKVKNLGTAMALDVILNIEYEFSNGGNYNFRKNPLKLGNIEKDGNENIKLVEVYESPDSQDSFNLKKCILNFHDITSKQEGEASKESDIFSDLQSSIDEGVTINFSKKK